MAGSVRRLPHIHDVWPAAALLALVLVPTVCVLWFMLEAVSNERLAVRQKLVDAYDTQLREAAEALEEHWQAKLDLADMDDAELSPARIFEHLIEDEGVSRMALEEGLPVPWVFRIWVFDVHDTRDFVVVTLPDPDSVLPETDGFQTALKCGLFLPASTQHGRNVIPGIVPPLYTPVERFSKRPIGVREEIADSQEVQFRSVFPKSHFGCFLPFDAINVNAHPLPAFYSRRPSSAAGPLQPQYLFNTLSAFRVIHLLGSPFSSMST